MKPLVYDHSELKMVHPMAFYQGEVEFENDYYHKDINYFLKTYKESQVLGYFLSPEHGYFSIKLKTPIDGYVDATPCIFFKRNNIHGNREYTFLFDTEYDTNKDISETPYVVLMRGCDDGHLGFAVKSLEEAKNILNTADRFDILDLQDINELIKLEFRN